VAEADARLYLKIFVCPSCQTRAQDFEAQVRTDLHVLQRDIETLLRVGVRSGYFDALEQSATYTLAERMAALIRWSDTVSRKKEERCQVPPTIPTTILPTSLPTPSSTGDTKPHVETLRMLSRGSNGSSSSTE
jgi:hypothetical protein